MANTITSPNMNMPIPNPGVDTGPDWANNLNSSLGIVDVHDHSPGFGVQITASGININSDLSFSSNNATTIRSVRFVPQVSPLALVSDVGCLYESGVDLYYNDGAGNQVRMTQGGGVAGSPGSIGSLSSPASATYVAGSSTFVWQSDASTPANMDAAAYILRNLSASSKGLTLSPPAAMGADYGLTLPSLPGSQSFMTVDAAGAMAAPVVFPLATAGIAAQAVTAAKIANATITTTQIASATIVAANIAAGVIPVTKSQVFNSSSTWTAPAGVTEALVELVSGGGAGGSGEGGVTGGGGGAGSMAQIFTVTVVPASVYTVTVGAGGLHSATLPHAGAAGGDSIFLLSGTVLAKVRGAAGGAIGGTGSGGTGGTVNGNLYMAGGVGGKLSGPTAATSTAGEASPFAAGGTAQSSALAGGGGGAGYAGAGGDGGHAGGTNAGSAGAANSGAGGGGGGEGGVGGDGGSGFIKIIWVAP